MSAEALRTQIRAQVRGTLGTAKARDSDVSHASITALMQRFEAGYATGNAEEIVACFAPDVQWVLPDARVLLGRDACLALLKARFASPTEPKFSDSHMRVFGQTVVQSYQVSVPLAGGQTGTYAGTDVYEITYGLITRKDAYWKQAGAAKPTAGNADGAAAAPTGVVVPLRVGAAGHAAALAELFRRLAASPALLRATQSGLLRFDLRVDEAVVTAVAASSAIPLSAMDAAACCDSCKAGNHCDCSGKACHQPAPAAGQAVHELQGVISEKRVQALAPSVATVRLSPRAVMTPLGKEALRKRGITIDRGIKT